MATATPSCSLEVVRNLCSRQQSYFGAEQSNSAFSSVNNDSNFMIGCLFILVWHFMQKFPQQDCKKEVDCQMSLLLKLSNLIAS